MFEAPRVSMHSAHEGSKVVSPAYGPHLPPTRYPCYSFLLALVVEEHNRIFWATEVALGRSRIAQ